jgi:hypothetical protein
MRPEFAPLRVTIIDFLAAFLPGIAWLLLLVTLADALCLRTLCGTLSPVGTAASLVASSSTKALVALLLAALALGYAIKPLTNRMAERLVRLPDFVIGDMKRA